MITAKIVGDSISPQGHRITSMELTLPYQLISKLKDFREFSISYMDIENIPFEDLKKSIQQNPFTPIAWQK